MCFARVNLWCALACVALMTGCVRRTITITSNPPGALLWLNHREIGRTPVQADFLYYGTYDVVLEADGYETLLTSGQADPPLWDTIPFDFLSEVSPGTRQVNIAWHFDLQPRQDDPGALLDRARHLREKLLPAAREPEPSAAKE